MTYIEAVSSGKAFRLGAAGAFLTYEEHMENGGFGRADILAKTFEVAADVTITITKAAFDEAWEVARAGSLKIKPAGQSEFYLKLARSLKVLG